MRKKELHNAPAQDHCHNIIVDVTGSDRGQHECVDGVFRAMTRRRDLSVVLVGNARLAELQLAHVAPRIRARLTFVHAPMSLPNDCRAQEALRSDHTCAQRVALELLRDGHGCAMVTSAGTGGIVALSWSLLDRVPGIDRPALATEFPSSGDRDPCLLDIGALVSTTPERMAQNAMLGLSWLNAMSQGDRTRVGVLNFGREQNKGDHVHRCADELINAIPGCDNVGYVEAHQLFSDVADVVVCDPMTGNAMIKVLEGLGKTLIEKTQRSLTLYRLIGKLIGRQRITDAIRHLMSSSEYAGARFLGIVPVVIKAHGHVDAEQYARSIEYAIAQSQYPMQTLSTPIQDTTITTRKAA